MDRRILHYMVVQGKEIKRRKERKNKVETIFN